MSQFLRIFGNLTEVLSRTDARSVLFDRSTSHDPAVRETVAAIIASVRHSGDVALRELAARFDGVALDTLEVPDTELQEALGSTPPALRRAMQRTAANIRSVHRANLPRLVEIESEPGVLIGRRPDPFERIGIYAPGGRAAYPSSVLMGAIPAREAGVREIILCSPPGADGKPPQSVLAACAIAEVDRVFCIGGAGAIAAMAFGTASLPRVQKIVGPGNAFVAEAKLQLSGICSFDSPAGPSELLVLADSSADPMVIVREMLAQAEHDPLAVVVCLCSDEQLATRIATLLQTAAAAEPRHTIIAAALRDRGAILWTDTRAALAQFASDFAAEHLLIVAEDPTEFAATIFNTGTIFIGAYSSVAFGDYMTGANHVLPTGTLARSYSGLSSLDFVRWTTYQRVTRDAAAALSDDVGVFAHAEGLPAHAAAALAWKRSN